MRVLVTGGAGFVGQHLVKRLVADGHMVYVMDAKTYAATGWDDVEAAAYRLWESDVTSMDYVDRAFERAQPELVYHLAAESHVDRSLFEPSKAMLVNGVGTSNVASACARTKVPLVYCSTDEVYGDLEGSMYVDGAVEGLTPLCPSSPYSAGKASGEHAVQAAARSFGLVASITRGCNAFGPGQYPEKLVPIACRLLTQGAPVPLHGGGSQVRQWIHVEEFVQGLVLAGGDAVWRVPRAKDFPGVRVFNLAGPDRLSVRDLVFKLADTIGGSLDKAVSAVGDRPGQDRLYALSATHTHHSLGFKAVRRITDRHELDLLLESYRTGSEVRLTSWQ